MNAITTPDVSIDRVRRTLKRETEYVRKQHVPTGRVLVEALVNQRHSTDPAAEAQQIVTEAAEALRAAGYTVEQHAQHTNSMVVTAEPGQEA